MKKRIFFMMALSAMLLVGCSVDSLNDTLLMETTDLELNETVKQPFKIQESGEMNIPFYTGGFTECPDLTLVLCEGEGYDPLLGSFHTSVRACTNHDDIYTLKGIHFFPKGDQLWFYSEEFGTDAIGMWRIFIYEGGSGRFEGATGMVKVYENADFHSASKGTYTSYGYGSLDFIR